MSLCANKSFREENSRQKRPNTRRDWILDSWCTVYTFGTAETCSSVWDAVAAIVWKLVVWDEDQNLRLVNRPSETCIYLKYSFSGEDRRSSIKTSLWTNSFAPLDEDLGIIPFRNTLAISSNSVMIWNQRVIFCFDFWSQFFKIY